MTTPETVPVTQADRQCAVDFVEAWKEGQGGEQVAAIVAAHRIEATRDLEDKVARLRLAMNRQASAVRSLQANEQAEINILRKGRNEAHAAVSTLDSERQANEILTDELHELKAQLAEARGLLERCKKVFDHHGLALLLDPEISDFLSRTGGR